MTGIQVSDMAQFVDCKPSEMSQREFVQTFGDVYEHSPWVAERTFAQGIDRDHDVIAVLHQAMASVLDKASTQEQLALINAHPDLAGKAAVSGELTQSSKDEQSGAGIHLCNEEEFARFQRFNTAYKEKFGFPFIMAVKGANRHQILAAFEKRLPNDPQTEFNTALAEINKIAGFRLAQM